MSALQNFFAFFNGMVAGWSQVCVMQPFEIIKVRLQTQPENNKQYLGIVDCFKKILVNEGPMAFYKGSLTPFIGVGFVGSLRFGVFDNAKSQLAQMKNIKSSELKLYEKSFCAMIAGIVTSFAVCLVQHTRIRIQIQRTQAERIYTGSLDALLKIYKNYGIRGLFRGQAPATVRQVTGLVFFFTTIEAITQSLTPQGADKKHLPLYIPLIAGGIGGTAYWIFNYPFDYVKTLMQTDKFGQFKYKNMTQCFKMQYAKGGMKTFYKGFTICMMRSFPVNAAAMITYRIMQRISNVSAH